MDALYMVYYIGTALLVRPFMASAFGHPNFVIRLCRTSDFSPIVQLFSRSYEKLIQNDTIYGLTNGCTVYGILHWDGFIGAAFYGERIWTSQLCYSALPNVGL